MSVDDSYWERRISEQIRWKGNRRKCTGWVPGHSTFLPGSTWEERKLYGECIEHGTILLDHRWGRGVNDMIKTAQDGS